MTIHAVSDGIPEPMSEVDAQDRNASISSSPASPTEHWNARPPGNAQHIAWLEGILLAALAIIYIAVRLPTLTGHAIYLGWNSDAAIMGLMAKRMIEGVRHPVYFFGQSYMGPLTAFFSMFAGSILSRIGGGCCGPLALRIGSILEVGIGIAFYWRGLRISFGRSIALAATSWLILGPYYLFEASIAPIGAEIAFTVGGLLFWFFASRLEERGPWSRWHLFLFGLFCGFGWWMNQGCVFVIAGAAVVLALRSRELRDTLRAVHPVSRLLLRGTDLGWPSPSLATRLLMAMIDLTLLILLALALLPLVGLRAHPLFWMSPIGEPLTALVSFHLVADFTLRGNLSKALTNLVRQLWVTRVQILRAALLASAGALLGMSAVFAGRWAHSFPDTYGLSVPVIGISGFWPQMYRIIASDLWRFLGVDRGLLGTLAAIAFVLVLLALSRSRKGATSDEGRRAAFATIVFSLIFYAGSQRATSGAVRYMIVALPMWLAFFAEGVEQLWQSSGKSAQIVRRSLAVVAAILFTAAYVEIAVSAVRQVRAGGTGEYAAFTTDFDPMATIEKAESAGYRICYSGYWNAYRLQWLSDDRLEMIPYRSYDRMPDESARFEHEPVPKCMIDGAGNVAPYRGLPRSRAVLRQATAGYP